MDNIEIMLKEYETLRTEILTSMQNRNTILSFGLAVMGAILTASIAASKSDSISLSSILMLVFALPAISYFVIFIWLGEYQRMQRAGKFVMNLERRINEEAQKEILSWETNLRTQRRHMKYPYNTTIMLITLISLVSFTLGIVMAKIKLNQKFVAGLMGLIINLIIYCYSVKKIRKLQL